MIVYIFQKVLTIKVAQEIIQRTLAVYQPAILLIRLIISGSSPASSIEPTKPSKMSRKVIIPTQAPNSSQTRARLIFWASSAPKPYTHSCFMKECSLMRQSRQIEILFRKM